MILGIPPSAVAMLFVVVLLTAASAAWYGGWVVGMLSLIGLGLIVFGEWC